MVKVQNLNKKIGSFRLNNLTFELPAGYIMGVIGENGAGKTTLLQLLAGLRQATDGQIQIAEKDVSFAGSIEAKDVKNEIGVVLHGDWFDGNRSLIKNANTYGAYFEKYSQEDMKNYLSRFGLAEGKRYRTLSKGEKLKYAFAFALAHQPKLLILDEPTANFDKEFRHEFISILKEFIANGDKSVILSSHLTGDMDRIADYILYLEKGNQIIMDDMEALREAYRLVTGDAYKIKLLKDRVVHMEDGSYGAKALVRHSNKPYDASLHVAVPTIEDIMFYISKRKGELHYGER